MQKICSFNSNSNSNSNLFIYSKHKNINKVLSKTVYSAMLTQEIAKKPYGYQVNCHLKFGNSSHFKIKQTIKSEDKQESKKKQKKATA